MTKKYVKKDAIFEAMLYKDGNADEIALWMKVISPQHDCLIRYDFKGKQVLEFYLEGFGVVATIYDNTWILCGEKGLESLCSSEGFESGFIELENENSH